MLGRLLVAGTVAVTVVSLLILTIVVWVVVDGDSQDRATPEPAVQATPVEPTPVQEEQQPEPKPVKSFVPDVTGMNGKNARQALSSAGLSAFVAKEVSSPRPAGTVLRQLRKAGTSMREGSSVGLVLARPYPRVPATAGTLQAVASRRLRDAGFRVRVVREVVTSGRDGVVLRQSPVGGVRLRPHGFVTLVVASLVRPVAPPAPTQNCTAGYRPCLVPAPDYDCAGGSGDGPRYTGLVYVTGSDPYDLDADGDGVACES